jgi:hypothetical protein
MRRFPWTATGFVVAGVSACAEGTASGQEPAFPDFDLAIASRERVMGAPEEILRFPASAILRTSPAGTDGRVGARAWSLSLLARGGARIVEARTEGTPAEPSPAGLRDGGYEKTELTQGNGNEGVVSAVILSFLSDVFLPGSGEATLLHLTVEAVVPAAGCTQMDIEFVDGLVGSGQPVKNIITYGEDFGFTRRDDGGALDNDTDGYESSRFFVCDGPYFVRGDVNGDLDLTLSDGVLIFEHLFLETGQLACPHAADIVDDGTINLSDGVSLLNHLFLGGAPPPAPYPDCGLAPPPQGGHLDCDPSGMCR